MPITITFHIFGFTVTTASKAETATLHSDGFLIF